MGAPAVVAVTSSSAGPGLQACLRVLGRSQDVPGITTDSHLGTLQGPGITDVP